MQKQNFIDPEKVLLEAGLLRDMIVADLGCGNGFFTIPAAKIVGEGGQAWAIDILEEALGNLTSSAHMARLSNIRTRQCDLDRPGACDVPELSCDFVIIGKVLPQMEDPAILLREAYRIMKTRGRILVVEWKKQNTLLGPRQDQRIGEEKVRELLERQTFKLVSGLTTDAFHYGLVYQK